MSLPSLVQAANSGRRTAAGAGARELGMAPLSDVCSPDACSIVRWMRDARAAGVYLCEPQSNLHSPSLNRLTRGSVHTPVLGGPAVELCSATGNDVGSQLREDSSWH